MKLLVLGGTGFLGRHLVEAALARAHDVTLFNRGKTDPELFPEAERLRGDREGGLDALRGRRWDAAIDTSGYVPRAVRASAELLAGAVERYVFISSVAVYADFRMPGIDETAPLAQLPEPSLEEVTGATYGPLKAASEQAAEEVMRGRVLAIRPGLIAGPHDPTDRFTYWPRRIAQGGEVLVPGPPERAVQLIDVRDLAEWTVRMAESRASGVYNAAGLEYRLTMSELVQTCIEVSGAAPTIAWVDGDFLRERGVVPWVDVPLWAAPEFEGFVAVDSGKAIEAGLRFRPLAETVRDTLAWDAARPEGARRGRGLAPERERELLAAWRHA